MFVFGSGKLLPFSCDDKYKLLIVMTQPIKRNLFGLSTSITPKPHLNNHLNVSKAQEELLLWHNVFGHYNI